MRRGLLLLFALAAVPLLPAPSAVRADEAPSVKQGVDDIQKDINGAIDRGVLWLLKKQQSDGSWGEDSFRYPTGMTGLALYTLLKSGVPIDHPCVALGFRSLLSVDPHETYVLACQLMALGAASTPAYRPRMQVLAKRLMSFETRGTWSYPLAHEGPGWAEHAGIPDLSNAQFAVLGLYAAHRAGFSIPRKLLQDIVRRTRSHQQIPRRIKGRPVSGTSAEAAGFAYRGPGQTGHGPATGSMTCAGITVLEICRRMLGGKLPGRQARQLETSVAHALTWLGDHWSVEENPGKEQNHKLYYLYGLERVGSLLGLEAIGGHAWYSEGARALLKIQKKDGEWGKASETAFALLFLLRATKGEVTGQNHATSALSTYVSKENSPIRLRAEGHSPMKVWTTSVHPDVIAGHGDRWHLQFTHVEYMVNEKVQVTVAQGPPPHGADPTHRVVLHFPHAGKYTVRARGHVDGPQGKAVVLSDPLEVDVKLLVQPWAWHEAGWMRRDRRPPGQVSATSSSHNHNHQGPARAVDHHTESYWVCQPKTPRDPSPTLHIQVMKRVKANAVVLAPVARRDSERRNFDRPTRFEILVNGKGDPIVATPEPDELQSTVVRLPAVMRIKTLDIAVTDRTPGGAWPGECGFREVTLEIETVARPEHQIGADGRITLACETPGVQIHFTLDGRIPRRGAPLYEAPFTRPGPTRLHAFARLASGETSRLLIVDLP